MTRRDRQAVWLSFAIGLLATALLLIAHAQGRLSRMELKTYDLRCEYANGIQPDPRLVILAIDDTALDIIGRWPWTRSKQAALIELAAELGAKRLIIDLLWEERERPVREISTDDEIRLSPRELDNLPTQLAYPDKELAAAIAEAGNVYMAFSYSRQSPESLMRSPEFQAAVDAAFANDGAGLDLHIAELKSRRERNIRPGDEALVDLKDRARLVALFQKFPVYSPKEAFEDLGIKSTPALVDNYDNLRLEALRRLLANFFQNDPKFVALSWQQQLEQAFRDVTGKPFDAQATIARLLDQALAMVLGDEALEKHSRVGAPKPINALSVEAIQPSLFSLLREARRAGSVEFQADDSDGVVRRLPIFARHGDRVFAQLAVAAAIDELGIDTAKIRCRSGEIEFPILSGATPLVVQVDDKGEALVPWVPSITKNGTKIDSTRRYESVPMDALWSLLVTRQTMKRNIDDMFAGLTSLASSDPFKTHPGLRESLDQYSNAKTSERSALLAEKWDEHKAARVAQHAAGLDLAKLLPSIAEKLNSLVDSTGGNAEGASGAELRKLVEITSTVLTLEDANKSLSASEVEASTRLRNLLADKLVFIGYTANAVADAKPIPTAGSAPGVLGHVNLLNGLLTGQLVTWVPNWLNLIIAGCAGILSTLISARMRPRLGLLLIAFLIVAFLAIAGFIAFYRYRVWIALTPGVAALFIPYLLISVYRYVFIDGERRHLATTLGQYTSKQIAKQMAENPELCRRAESREVTAMFTDLRGFTTISERIGAERTQKVLNTCLGRFTEVMLQHEAMVNKFIGDGIFAFWNPVIFPQPDHVLKACETAIDLQSSLVDLQAEMKRSGGDDVFSELQLRIGVATGNAIVGPCGSEQKYDYTCIGDSVNLAARLESANKAFGTRILVAGPARDVVGDRFVFRFLGGVQVKGKVKAVPVYELLGRKGEVPTDTEKYALRFATAVAHFQGRKWSEARSILSDCMQTKPEDMAAAAYLDQLSLYESKPPPESWTGAIELMEK